jgi:LysR family cyn operon transcriptional activator
VHVTQSTLSHQIRQLEEEVGQPLFDRIGKKVVTTEAGELFLAFATRALKEVDHGIAMLKPGGGGLTGEVRIGATHTFNIGLIPECVALFLARHPTVRVRVDELAADQIGAKLHAGELDIGIAYRPTADRPLVRAALQRGDGAGRVATRTRSPAQAHPHGRAAPAAAGAAARLLRDRTCSTNASRRAAPSRSSCAEMSTIAPMLGLVLRSRSARSSRSTRCRRR